MEGPKVLKDFFKKESDLPSPSPVPSGVRARSPGRTGDLELEGIEDLDMVMRDLPTPPSPTETWGSEERAAMDRRVIKKKSRDDDWEKELLKGVESLTQAASEAVERSSAKKESRQARRAREKKERKEAEKKDAGVGKKGKARNKSKKKSIPVTKKTSRKSPGDSWEEKIKGILKPIDQLNNKELVFWFENINTFAWAKDLEIPPGMNNFLNKIKINGTNGSGYIKLIKANIKNLNSKNLKTEKDEIHLKDLYLFKKLIDEHNKSIRKKDFGYNYIINLNNKELYKWVDDYLDIEEYSGKPALLNLIKEDNLNGKGLIDMDESIWDLIEIDKDKLFDIIQKFNQDFTLKSPLLEKIKDPTLINIIIKEDIDEDSIQLLNYDHWIQIGASPSNIKELVNSGLVKLSSSDKKKLSDAAELAGKKLLEMEEASAKGAEAKKRKKTLKKKRQKEKKKQVERDKAERDRVEQEEREAEAEEEAFAARLEAVPTPWPGAKVDADVTDIFKRYIEGVRQEVVEEERERERLEADERVRSKFMLLESEDDDGYIVDDYTLGEGISQKEELDIQKRLYDDLSERLNIDNIKYESVRGENDRLRVVVSELRGEMEKLKMELRDSRESNIKLLEVNAQLQSGLSNPPYRG